MQTLAYAVVHRVKQLLDRVLLDDLVAVFTRLEPEGGLLVYNIDTAPRLSEDVENDGWQSASLPTLRSADYAGYDGPVIGLDAIDVLLPDVPTHGANFYALERLCQDAGHREVLRRTACRLADRIRASLSVEPEAAQRVRRKLVQLCLPTWLAGQSLEGLVALSGHGLPGPECGRGGRVEFGRLGQPNDLPSMQPLAPDSWMVSLEEVGLLARDLTRGIGPIIELRPALRQVGAADVLAGTCRELARRFWQEWQLAGDVRLLEAAYSLGTESWLAADEADDLVAVLPDADFEAFVTKGSLRRVYRVLIPPGQRTLGAHVLEDLLTGDATLSSPKTPILALPALKPTLQSKGAKHIFDLGPVLWKAGLGMALARTFWLFSRDLLNPPVPIWGELQVSPAAITDLARRAALIYSLADPWDWRQGRHSDLLAKVYGHLDRCLQNQERAPESPVLAPYFSALRAWYACATADDAMGSLGRAVEAWRVFRADCQDLGEPHYEERAQHLIEIGASVLHPDHTAGGLENTQLDKLTSSGAVGALLRDAVDTAVPAQEPSPLFEVLVGAYLANHKQWRQFQADIFNQRPKSAALDDLRDRLVGLRRRVHAPQHELRIAWHILDEEIGQVNHLRSAVGGGAVIEVLSRGQQVPLETRQTIALEVQNSGSQAAADLVLTLERYQGFELLVGNTSVSLSLLRPGERQRLEFQIRAREPALALLFHYRFRDAERRVLSGERRVLIEAVGSPRAQRTKINPFEVGRPVSGAGTAFFGRQEELSKILARLAKEGGTQPLALRGPRRIGKSSLLRELEAILDHPGEEGRTLNLAPELQRAVANIRPVVASLQRMERVERGDAESFARFLRGLLRDVCRKLDLEAAPMESAFREECDVIGVAYAFMSQIDRALLRRPDQRLVVLLDELDEVFRPEFREVAGQLRHIIETQKRVSWIAATTRLVPSATGTYGSPWFNLLEIIDIRAMDWRSATQLVRQLGGKAGFEWSAAAVTAVLDLTGQRPYLLQLLGARVTDDLSAIGHDSVESASVAAAANRLLDETSTAGSYLGYVWHEAQWLGRLIQWTVDRAPGPISLLDTSRAIRDEAATRGLALSGTEFDAAFDERISWLTQIADVMEVRSGLMNYAIPLTQRLVHEMLGRTDNFVTQAIQGLDQELKPTP